MDESKALEYMNRLRKEMNDNPDFLPIVRDYMGLIDGFASIGLLLYEITGAPEVMQSALINVFWLGYMRGLEGESFELDPDVWGDFLDE